MDTPESGLGDERIINPQSQIPNQKYPSRFFFSIDPD
jgi:hypothetical protein